MTSPKSSQTIQSPSFPLSITSSTQIQSTVAGVLADESQSYFKMDDPTSSKTSSSHHLTNTLIYSHKGQPSASNPQNTSYDHSHSCEFPISCDSKKPSPPSQTSLTQMQISHHSKSPKKSFEKTLFSNSTFTSISTSVKHTKQRSKQQSKSYHGPSNYQENTPPRTNHHNNSGFVSRISAPHSSLKSLSHNLQSQQNSRSYFDAHNTFSADAQSDVPLPSFMVSQVKISDRSTSPYTEEPPTEFQPSTTKFFSQSSHGIELHLVGPKIINSCMPISIQAIFYGAKNLRALNVSWHVNTDLPLSAEQTESLKLNTNSSVFHFYIASPDVFCNTTYHIRVNWSLDNISDSAMTSVYTLCQNTPILAATRTEQVANIDQIVRFTINLLGIFCSHDFSSYKFEWTIVSSDRTTNTTYQTNTTFLTLPPYAFQIGQYTVHVKCCLYGFCSTTLWSLMVKSSNSKARINGGYMRKISCQEPFFLDATQSEIPVETSGKRWDLNYRWNCVDKTTNEECLSQNGQKLVIGASSRIDLCTNASNSLSLGSYQVNLTIFESSASFDPSTTSVELVIVSDQTITVEIESSNDFMISPNQTLIFVGKTHNSSRTSLAFEWDIDPSIGTEKANYLLNFQSGTFMLPANILTPQTNYSLSLVVIDIVTKAVGFAMLIFETSSIPKVQGLFVDQVLVKPFDKIRASVMFDTTIELTSTLEFAFGIRQLNSYAFQHQQPFQLNSWTDLIVPAFATCQGGDCTSDLEVYVVARNIYGGQSVFSTTVHQKNCQECEQSQFLRNASALLSMTRSLPYEYARNVLFDYTSALSHSLVLYEGLQSNVSSHTERDIEMMRLEIAVIIQDLMEYFPCSDDFAAGIILDQLRPLVLSRTLSVNVTLSAADILQICLDHLVVPIHQNDFGQKALTLFSDLSLRIQNSSLDTSGDVQLNKAVESIFETAKIASIKSLEGTTCDFFHLLEAGSTSMSSTRPCPGQPLRILLSTKGSVGVYSVPDNFAWSQHYITVMDTSMNLYLPNQSTQILTRLKRVQVTNQGLESVKVINIDPPIEIYLEIKYGNVNSSSFVCGYYDVDLHSWKTTGCQTIIQKGAVVCKCNHLTDFSGWSSETDGAAEIPNQQSKEKEGGKPLNQLFFIIPAIGIFLVTAMAVAYFYRKARFERAFMKRKRRTLSQVSNISGEAKSTQPPVHGWNEEDADDTVREISLRPPSPSDIDIHSILDVDE